MGIILLTPVTLTLFASITSVLTSIFNLFNFSTKLNIGFWCILDKLSPFEKLFIIFLNVFYILLLLKKNKKLNYNYPYIYIYIYIL